MIRSWKRKKASRRFRQEAFFLMKNQRAGYTSPIESHNFRCPCQPHGTELKVPVFNCLLLLQKNWGMSNKGVVGALRQFDFWRKIGLLP
jgi:hypothetical protein